MQVRRDIYTSSTYTWVRKKAEKRTLDPMLFLPWPNALKTPSVPFSLTISSTVHPLSSSFSTKAFTELALLEWTRKECWKWNQTNRWREVITNINLLTKLLAVNGLIADQSQFYPVAFLACNQRQLFNGEWKDQPQKFQSFVQMLLKCINQGMGDISLVDFWFDGCSLRQRLHRLQYNVPKRPYPAWLRNHRLIRSDWSVHKSQQFW